VGFHFVFPVTENCCGVDQNNCAIPGVLMKRLYWVLLAVLFLAFAVLAIPLGMTRNADAFLAPARMLLAVIGLALYLLPSMLAVHRDCKATAWIIALNILLGWTVFGWVAAIGWAASGKPRTAPPTLPAPPSAVVTGH